MANAYDSDYSEQEYPYDRSKVYLDDEPEPEHDNSNFYTSTPYRAGPRGSNQGTGYQDAQAEPESYYGNYYGSTPYRAGLSDPNEGVQADYYGNTSSDRRDHAAEYDGTTRPSVTSQVGILDTSKTKDYFGRRSWYMIAALVVILLILVAVAVTLGLILTRSDHPCSACDCESSILMGQITDNFNIPINGAIITYADNPNTTLAVSDMTGRFRVTGVCATPQRLAVNYDLPCLYASEEQMTKCSAYKEVNCTSFFSAQLRRLERPFITDNPRSKLRLKGQNVALCCSAEGVPSPTKYEWLKDGTVIENGPTNGDKLVLKELTKADSGKYACRVQNEGGMVLSDSARLTVTADPVGCDPAPSSHFIQLPEDCIQPGTNRAEYDVGTCEKTPCSGKIKEQTQCDDSESYCCQAQERETVNVNCDGYTLPVQRVTSCGCSQCAPKSIQISGRVVSADTLDSLNNILVYYNNKNVTVTDTAGRFLFSTQNAVSRVSLTFRDDNFNRVLNTTVVFQVNEESTRYGIIKMLPVNAGTQINFNSQVDNMFSILSSPNDNSTPIASIKMAANTVVSQDGNMYNGTVRVTVNNIDLRSRKGASLAPGDATTVDDSGYKVPIRLFGVFSFTFTDPSGQQPVFVTGHAQVRLTHPVLAHLCQEQSGESCDVMLWALNTKTGIWEKISAFVTTNAEDPSRRKKRQDSVVVVANLVLREYEWYSIADIDNTDRCWAKVIGYSDENFNANTVLPFMYQLTSVLKETQADEQETDKLIIYRISQPSSVTENGLVGVCVPLECPKAIDTTQGHIEAYLSATVEDTYMKPALPTVVPYQEDVDYYIANHENIETQPQILLRRLVSDPKGPLYPGGEAGEIDGSCSSAGTEDYHFKYHCPNCNDVICNTFHSVAKSPLNRHLQTFYSSIPPDKQSYCFIGLQIRTSSSSVKVTITSNSSEGLFYGRREVTLRKPFEEDPNEQDEFINACMEFKCSGEVFEKKDSHHDVTRVAVNVNDIYSSTCSVQMEAQDFSLGQTQVPFTFDDPQTYGKRTGIHKESLIRTESVCANDAESPQTTNTKHCEINDKFLYAALITCS